MEALPPFLRSLLYKFPNPKSPKPQTTTTTAMALDPKEPSIPISTPISTLADLESRSYLQSFHFPFNRSSVPLPRSAVDPPNRRRILVCHDMMGGYVDDRWVQGGGNENAYAIWHWYLIDVFVYFSHNLVTIPPVGWVNAAHANGVKVLGTFIMEWDEGAEIARTLLQTEESARTYAGLLVELASALGFDGWLINIEVRRLDRKQVSNVKEFISYLTQTMHAASPGSLIIWYDSVTVDGQLIYQNQLNEKNKPFFDLCDGIFVNYFWKENGPKISAAFAGSRQYDVYMGIDVFGRGTFGGGQWNTNFALDLLREDDISTAIFAPGWVYENLPKIDFQSNQNRWWGLVKQSWGVLRSNPQVLPFYSNFDQGHGLHFSINGLQVADRPWNNLSCQGIQPILEPVYPNQADMLVFINFEDESYNGGSSITCKGSFGDSGFSATRLFKDQLLLGILPVHISYSVKSNGVSQMGLLLQFTSNANEQVSILLVDDDDISYVDKLTNNIGKFVCVPVKKTSVSSWILHEGSIAMNNYTMTDISLFCYFGKQHKPVGDGLSYYASIGHISIRNSAENAKFPPASSWAIQFQDFLLGYNSKGNATLSLTLVWKLEDENTQSFTSYNIFVEKLGESANNSSNAGKDFLGVARVERFYVSELEIPVGVEHLRFFVQVIDSDGASQELDESPALSFAV